MIDQPIDAEVVPTQAVAVRSQTDVLSVSELEQQFALAVRQRELLSEYIKKQLKPGKHFYQRGDQKPSLAKEGAEIILMPHNLAPDYELVSGPDSPPDDNRPYQITVKCILRRKGDVGSFVGSGMGSAGSHKGYWKRERGKPDSWEYQPRQTDKFLCHNATLKMAQKSAMISATINSTAASEFFTQDMDDASNVDTDKASRKPVEPSTPRSGTTQPPAAPAPAAQAPQRIPASPEQCLTKFVQNLDAEKLREKSTQFCIDMAWLMPNEKLEDLPLRFAPRTGDQYVAFLAKLTAWSVSGKADKPYEANPEPEPPKKSVSQGPAFAAGSNKPIEVPRDENVDCNSPSAPWRSFPVPFGKNAGVRLADLDKNVLYGFWANFQPEETWTNNKGEKVKTKPEKLAKDQKFRDQLDEAGKHYEFTKKD